MKNNYSNFGEHFTIDGYKGDFNSDYFIKKFDLKDIEVNFIKRGTKYPVADIVQSIDKPLS